MVMLPLVPLGNTTCTSLSPADGIATLFQMAFPWLSIIVISKLLMGTIRNMLPGTLYCVPAAPIVVPEGARKFGPMVIARPPLLVFGMVFDVASGAVALMNLIDGENPYVGIDWSDSPGLRPNCTL